MSDDIQTGSYVVKDSRNNARTVFIMRLRTARAAPTGGGYEFGQPRHLLDGQAVTRIEKGLYRISDTGEYLTSSDPAAP